MPCPELQDHPEIPSLTLFLNHLDHWLHPFQQYWPQSSS